MSLSYFPSEVVQSITIKLLTNKNENVFKSGNVKFKNHSM